MVEIETFHLVISMVGLWVGGLMIGIGIGVKFGKNNPSE